MTIRALIIGASGGIGGALCQHHDAAGYEVTCLSRRDHGLEISEPTSVAACFAELSGPYDRIVLATGMLAPASAEPEKSLTAIDAENLKAVIAVNTIGTALILQQLPRLLDKAHPTKIGVLTARVGSIGDNQLGGWYSYRASKAAANQLIRTAAIELSRKFPQATLVALHPGTVETEFTKRYPAHKKVSAAKAAANLVTVMDGLGPADTGHFFDWSGAKVPW